jgi:ABC-type dipeptide/oligopeptide/nickel transport system ATPase component
MTKLLETVDLVTNFYTYEGVVKALDHVSLSHLDSWVNPAVGKASPFVQ